MDPTEQQQVESAIAIVESCLKKINPQSLAAAECTIVLHYPQEIIDQVQAHFGGLVTVVSSVMRSEGQL